MDGRKVLATLGILAYVWPGTFVVVALPFFAVGHLLNMLKPVHPAIGVLVILICGSAATWVSIRVFRRAFRSG
ncbi:MAG: hypothetical protein OXI90_08175 [Gammaproteobacteria bacterium]|nr:hypothetical protein [Gammaproteobacteria bacterium]